MKTNISFITPLLLAVLSAACLAQAAFNPKNKCKDMSEDVWNLNSRRCIEGFNSGSQAKEADPNTVKKVCDCVTDELVNNLTCLEINKFKTDKNFADNFQKRVIPACAEKHGLKPKTSAL